MTLDVSFFKGLLTEKNVALSLTTAGATFTITGFSAPGGYPVVTAYKSVASVGMAFCCVTSHF